MNCAISDQIVCFITAPSDAEAEMIAAFLIEKKLAACCTVIKGVLSIYEWEGKVNRSHECQIIAKTRSDLFPALMEEVKRVHSYEVPEVIALPVSMGLPAYLSWIDSIKK